MCETRNFFSWIPGLQVSRYNHPQSVLKLSEEQLSPWVFLQPAATCELLRATESQGQSQGQSKGPTAGLWMMSLHLQKPLFLLQ